MGCPSAASGDESFNYLIISGLTAPTTKRKEQVMSDSTDTKEKKPFGFLSRIFSRASLAELGRDVGIPALFALAALGGIHVFEAVGADGPADCPAVGDRCPDGSIYAGGNVKVYINGGGSVTVYTDDGITVRPAVNDAVAPAPKAGDRLADGTIYAGSNFAATPADAPNSYTWTNGKRYCEDLVSNGHDDWTLPTKGQLNHLYQNKNTGSFAGTFNESNSLATYHWSSEKHASFSSNAWGQRFSDGSQDSGNKNVEVSVRCVLAELRP
jgi:hypothetical protein